MIVILSHCNTTQKKERLKALIGSIKKKFPEDKILVYSHYEDVEPEYYSGSDFYIYDKNNLKSGKRFGDWIIVRPQRKKFYRWGDDWGYAVLEMIKRSSLFISSLGYEECLFLNYDIAPDSIENLNIFDQARNLENGEIGIFAPWGNTPESLNLTCFYLKLSKIDSDFFKRITLERYKAYDSNLIPEQVFYSIINESFGKKYKIGSFKTRAEHSDTSRALPEESYLKKYFGTLLPSRNPEGSENSFGLAAWTTCFEIDKIVVEIGNKEHVLKNKLIGEERKTSFFADLPNGIDIKKIWVKQVGSEALSKPYLIDGLDQEYWKNNHHEEI